MAPVGAERVPRDLGGGLIVTGDCGFPHLVGWGWRWWKCGRCALLDRVDEVRARHGRGAA